MEKIYINGVEYRYVKLRGRGKYIDKHGNAVNPKRRNQKCTIHYNQDGYPCFGGGVPVHLYVAHGWVEGYFDGAEVNHKDFDRKNYDYSNLEWVSHKDNLDYTLKNNYEVVCKSRQNENNGRAVLTKKQVLEIRSMYESGLYSVADIVRYYHPELKMAKDYKNIHGRYLDVIKRKTWKNI